MTGFEIWDTHSRNLLGDYDTEGEALDAVAAMIGDGGADCTESLMLVRVGPRGGIARLAAGHQLAERALARVPSRPKRATA